jgi:DNA-binding transcriptional LysR family regulator
LPHLVASRDTSQAVDNALRTRGLKRRIAVTVPNFAVVPYILESSDLLAVVGERIARRFASLGEVSCHQVPIDLESWSISAVWVRQHRADPAVAWLRAMLQQTAAII